MTPQPLAMRRGDTPIWDWQARDPSTGAAIDLTGAAITMTARRGPDIAPALFALTLGAGVTILDAAAGRVRTQPPAAATSALTADVRGDYDIEVRPAAGGVHTVAYGPIAITRDIST